MIATSALSDLAQTWRARAEELRDDAEAMAREGDDVTEIYAIVRANTYETCADELDELKGDDDD